MTAPLLVQALRCAQFVTAHPDVEISPPGEHVYWTARQNGAILAAEPGLSTLLDDLDRLLPADVEPASMGGRPCPSSGYCGCHCVSCLRGRHQCGCRKGCHVLCKSL